jgi:hypothetical protein
MLSCRKNNVYSDELISATELDCQVGRVLDMAKRASGDNHS